MQIIHRHVVDDRHHNACSLCHTGAAPAVEHRECVQYHGERTLHLCKGYVMLLELLL